MPDPKLDELVPAHIRNLDVYQPGKPIEELHRELGITGATFAIAAALLPGIVARARPSALERAAWGFAGWVVLMGQYGLYLYWNQSQRETFCDWFLLPSLGLMVLPAATTKRGAQLRLVAIYALSSITLFGKPTYALFGIAQLVSTMLDPEIVLDRKQRIVPIVQDNKNALLLQLPGPDVSEASMTTLQHALARGLEVVFQLEEGEILTEPVPSRERRCAILLFEATEGGAGVLGRLAGEVSAQGDDDSRQEQSGASRGHGVVLGKKDGKVIG